MRAVAKALLATLAALSLPMAANAGPTETIPVPYSIADAGRGAQLRVQAAVVLPIVLDPCGLSPAMAPVLERYRALAIEANDDRIHVDFAIARADYDYRMSLVDILCREFTEEQQKDVDTLNASIANSTMDRMGAVIAELAKEGK